MPQLRSQPDFTAREAAALSFSAILWFRQMSVTAPQSDTT